MSTCAEHNFCNNRLFSINYYSSTSGAVAPTNIGNAEASPHVMYESEAGCGTAGPGSPQLPAEI